jgi:RNA polymerase sigma factor (sigma-70 family)
MSRTSPCRSGVASSASRWLDGCANQEPLSAAAVIELARQVQCWRRHPLGAQRAPAALRRRGLRARNRLACRNLRLVAHIWSRHRSGLPLEAEGTADALQEAALNLLRAAELYDPSRGYRFSTYATFWVRRGFSVHGSRQRRLIPIPAGRQAMVMRAMQLAERHRLSTGALPTMPWLAQRVGPGGRPVKETLLRNLLLQWEQTLCLELDRPLSQLDGQEPAEAGATLLDQLADRSGADPTAAAAAAREAAAWRQEGDFPDAAALLASCAADGEDEQRSLLPQLLRALSQEERRLLWHRYLREHPLSAEQIESVMGLSRRRQALMEAQALQKLRQAARAEGLVVPESG